jgi:hypothetical protein
LKFQRFYADKQTNRHPENEFKGPPNKAAFFVSAIACCIAEMDVSERYKD